MPEKRFVFILYLISASMGSNAVIDVIDGLMFGEPAA